MAGTVLRFDRRRKGSPPKQALTAASEPILDLSTSFRSTMSSRGDNWQSLAWEMYDRVGELRYYVGWRSGSCSRVRLVASTIDRATGKPTGGIPDDDPNSERVKEIVRSIAGGPLGQSQLIKRVVESVSVAGESWVAILDTDEPNLPDNTPQMSWLALTRDEVKTAAAGGVEIELPSGGRHQFDPETDSIFRIWNPRARRASEPDSPVRATLDSLHEIVRTTKTISNASKSRLIGNGIVFVPEEMSIPATQGPTSDKTGLADQAALIGTPAVKQLQELLWQVATTAYDDDDSMAALIPMFATVKGEHVKNVSHLKFDNQVTQIAIQVRNDAISRLAMGLDVSPERLLGLGSNTNHWTAWQISDEDVQLHINPIMELICQALTAQVVNKVLIAEGLNPQNYTLWYDATGLTNDPDKSSAANAAWNSGAINGAAYIDFLGLPSGSGYDFNTMEGWQYWARDVVSRKPEMVSTFLPLLGPTPGTLPIDVTKPPIPTEGQPGLPAGQPSAEPAAPAQTPSSERRANDGQGDTQAAALYSNRHLALAERMLVNRALELAGKRRRKGDDYSRLRDIPMHETHRYMPPVAGEDVPGLIRGWDAALADDVVMRMGVDTEAMRAAVYAIVKRELTMDVVEGEVD